MEQQQQSQSPPSPTIYQIITKLLNGKSQTLNFTTPTIPIPSIKSQIQTLTSIPTHHQLLLSNGKLLPDNTSLVNPNSSPLFITLTVRLRGGKGGFGSLLRGAATKAGQKKTSNYDACRDMSGRRLRHVNAEKKMEEWAAGEGERRLEKEAEEFLKRNMKKVKKAGGGKDGAEKYVEKYRKDSAKCMEDVDKSVRESLGGGFFGNKRKGEDVGGGSKSKKLKIWMGKRKVDDSDSDDMDEEDSDDESGEENEKFVVSGSGNQSGSNKEVDGSGEENEKSVVTNNGNQSDSNKELDGSLASVTGEKPEGESSVGCSSESASEEEKESLTEGHVGSIKDCNDKLNTHEVVDASVKHEESLAKDSKDCVPLELKSSTDEAETTNVEAIISDSKLLINEGKVSEKSDCGELEKPLNFDEFKSAAEMEVLGLERLKTELQARGLKCGGTLQERSARLYLLKTTPLEKLPKKLLAKK